MRAHALLLQLQACSHFHNHKGPSFLDRPILPSEKPVTLCVSKDKQSHRLVGTSETFYESHSPPLVTLTQLAVAHPLPHTPSSLWSSSVLRSFLSVFSFLSIAQPRSLTSNCRHRQSHLDSPWDQPGLTSLPVKEETAIQEIHGSPPHQISPQQPASGPERVCSLHSACGPPFTQPLPPAQRSATTPIKGRSAGLLLPVGRLT